VRDRRPADRLSRAARLRLDAIACLDELLELLPVDQAAREAYNVLVERRARRPRTVDRPRNAEIVCRAAEGEPLTLLAIEYRMSMSRLRQIVRLGSDELATDGSTASGRGRAATR